MKTVPCCLAMLAALLVLTPAVAQEPDPYDRTEAEGCAGCHAPVAVDIQPFIFNEWIQTGHASPLTLDRNDNTYCAKCMSPYEADPDASYGENVQIPIEGAQGITCTICHPDHAVRVFFETPIGNYVVGSIDLPNPQGITHEDGTPVMGEWIPRFHGEETELCTYCHSGSHHEKRLTWMQFLSCTDCHMPEVPVTLSDGTVRPTRTHQFGFPVEDPLALAEKAEYACLGCHFSRDTDWAVDAILSGMIHNEKPEVDPGGPYTGIAGEPVDFDASNTIDPENDTLTYLWNFGDDTPPPFPSQQPLATHTYAEAGTYTVQLAVTDGVNDPVLEEVTVEISDPPEPAGDLWAVQIPFLMTDFTLELEDFAGILVVYTTYPDGATTVAIGMEMDGVIFWMDINGAIFFGNINRDAGTMSGIVFGHMAGSSVWFGEAL